MQHRLSSSFVPASALTCLVIAFVASANPDVTVLEAPQLGTHAVRSNTSIQSVVLAPNGSTSTSDGLVTITAGTPGQLGLSGFPAGVQLSLVWDPAPATRNRSGLPPAWLVDQQTNQPSTAFTDANGAAVVTVGARALSSGDGSGSADGPDIASVPLRVEAGSPANNAVLAHFSTIDFQIDVRNAITTTEETALTFGTVAATASAAHQAQLRVSAAGGVSSSNAGSARLVALGGAQPARITISGASAGATVQIILPGSSIELQHQTLGNGSARFVVDQFESLPTGAVVIDANGNATVRIGARLMTALTTQEYAPGVYRGTYSITFAY